MTEFELIEQVFARGALRQRQSSVARRGELEITLGIGDDCALLSAPRSGSKEQFAISTDMSVEGVHFFAGTDAAAVGHKSLAVNLSDLAAMGARPLAFTLALSVPQIDPAWVKRFARGLFALARSHDCALIGGDTTRGPLNICVTVIGKVPATGALRRSAAQAGDDVWLSGATGAAALAVHERLRGVPAASVPRGAAQRLDWPSPRTALGLHLARMAQQGLVHAAIDVSDGLCADLAHIARASSVRIEVQEACVPVPAPLRRVPVALRRACVFSGGDDYELAFTAPVRARVRLASWAQRNKLALTRIGCVHERAASRRGQTDKLAAVTVWDMHGQPVHLPNTGHVHFAAQSTPPKNTRRQ